MSTTTLRRPPRKTSRTVADLIHRLGDISADRILMHPAPGMATEQDVLECEALNNCLCELVDGTLVEKALGFYQSCLAVALIEFLGAYLRKNKRKKSLGFLAGADNLARLEKGLVRMPDVSFYFWHHFPNRKIKPTDLFGRTPDIAVEILSPGNTPGEMARTRREYFATGARLVWEIDGKKRIVIVYTAPEESITLTEDQPLTGGDVLPGFALPLKELFGSLEQG